MKSLCCLLAVIPSGENTRDAPTCRRRRRRKENGQAASAVYGKLGFSGRPMRWERDAGFLRDNALSARSWLFKV